MHMQNKTPYHMHTFIYTHIYIHICACMYLDQKCEILMVKYMAKSRSSCIWPQHTIPYHIYTYTYTGICMYVPRPKSARFSWSNTWQSRSLYAWPQHTLLYTHTHSRTHAHICRHMYICIYLGQKVRNSHGQIHGKVEVFRDGNDTFCVCHKALTEPQKLRTTNTVCMHACMYVCMHLCMIYIYIYMCVCVCACVCVCVCDTYSASSKKR